MGRIYLSGTEGLGRESQGEAVKDVRDYLKRAFLSCFKGFIPGRDEKERKELQARWKDALDLVGTKAVVLGHLSMAHLKHFEASKTEVGKSPTEYEDLRYDEARTSLLAISRLLGVKL